VLPSLIRSVLADPKPFVGFSDNTTAELAWHLGIGITVVRRYAPWSRGAVARCPSDRCRRPMAGGDIDLHEVDTFSEESWTGPTGLTGSRTADAAEPRLESAYRIGR